MTTQEASEKLKNASYFSTLGDNRKVVEMAIRSLEAWSELENDLTEMIFDYERCDDEYGDGAVSALESAIRILKATVKGVEE